MSSKVKLVRGTSSDNVIANLSPGLGFGKKKEDHQSPDKDSRDHNHSYGGGEKQVTHE